MAPPLLQLRDIHLTFGGVPTLEGAELSIAPRERICLVGRNGSGKSTLLKIAAGLLEADRGERFVDPGATIRYLPQEPDLTGFGTTRDYVEGGLGPGDDAYRAAYLLGELGLAGSEDPRSLSGGKHAAQRSRGRWPRRRISCFSTSRRTISICRPSNGWSARSPGSAPPSC